LRTYPKFLNYIIIFITRVILHLNYQLQIVMFGHFNLPNWADFFFIFEFTLPLVPYFTQSKKNLFFFSPYKVPHFILLIEWSFSVFFLFSFALLNIRKSFLHSSHKRNQKKKTLWLLFDCQPSFMKKEILFYFILFLSWTRWRTRIKLILFFMLLALHCTG
jgi:hypothetical protein